jgi:tetratricopeptide (TPR) repeat protein
MKILNLLDKAIQMLDSSSKAINLFKQLMDLSHKITRAEHPSSEEDVKEYYRVQDELVKEPKEAIARAYQVNTKIPPTTDTNIVAHYYDDAMQYIQKLGYNIDLLRKKATKEEMGKEEGRCWEGYEPVAGVPAYEKGSCQKKMEEVQEVIGMLDKAINFYDPSQERDESGKWSGSGGSSDGSSKYGHSFVSDAEADKMKNSQEAQSVVADHLDKALVDVESDDPEVEKAVDSANEAVNSVGKLASQDSPRNYYSRLGSLAQEIRNISDGLSKSDSKTARRNSDAFGSFADTIGEIREIFRNNTSK